jgi:Endonuclease/Exonuclease/phosphatase family
MKSFLSFGSINLTRTLRSLIVGLFIVASVDAQSRTSGPELLRYPDLVALYENEKPSQDLQRKVTELLATPFVNNSINSRGAKPGRPATKLPEASLRVATWNIERGLEFDAIKAALTNDQRFFRRLTPAMRSTRFDLKNVLDQAQRLSNADVVVLNEVDWGLKRTNYQNVARDLALATHMNYAYAVEFVEVDPLTLGTETLEGESGSDKAEMVKNLNVDTSRTLGLHGSAILSRFPLKNVRVVRFVNQGHDWYGDEKKAVSALEKGKHKAAGIVSAKG